MTRFLDLAGLALLVMWPTVAAAQDVLTLPQAVQETLLHNHQLRAAHASVQESDARVALSRSAFLPRISFVESWQRGNQPVFVFSSLLSSRQFAAGNFAIDALNSPGATGLFRGAVAVEQMLFDGGRTRASVTSAALQRQIASLSADATQADLIVSITDAYGRVVTARAAMKSADTAVSLAEEDRARGTLRRDAGMLNDADVLALNLHLAEVRERRIRATGDEVMARAELNRLMGSPIDRSYDVQEEAAPSAHAAHEAESLEALFALAEGNRPDLKRAATAEDVADAGRRQARAAWSPQVVAQAGVETNGTRVNDRAASWLVGGELRWSFSTGGAQFAERRAAAAAKDRARAEREAARAGAQVEIVAAQQRLASARARGAVAAEALAHAHESQRIVRDRFEAGLASASDVLRAAAAVSDAEVRRVSALVDTNVGSAMLDRAIGRQP